MLFPAFLAYQYNLPFICGATIVAMICSMIYHSDEENANGLLMDLAGVVAMVACMFHIVFQASTLFTFMNVIGVVYLNTAVWYYDAAFSAYEDEEFETYEFYHVAWHVLVALSVAAFIYSYHGSSLRDEGPTRLTRPIVTCEPKKEKKEGETKAGLSDRYCSVMFRIGTTWAGFLESKPVAGAGLVGLRTGGGDEGRCEGGGVEKPVATLLPAPMVC